MVCHNDDLLDPGAGYPDHPHADLEIVTWVLEGVLLHTDSAGNTTALEPGDVQVMSAGSGIRHAEVADAASGPTRFLQTWVRPDEPDTAPSWRHERVTPGTGVTALVGPDGLPIGTAGARLDVVRLDAGEAASLPAGGRTHLFWARGQGTVEDAPIVEGDALRLVDAAGVRFAASAPSELLVWSFRR